MTQVEQPAEVVKQPPEIKLTQEIRFAVVMYGGISLAIYMNGVAQELLKLVRATAEGDGRRALRSDKKLEGTECLEGTERVYRKLGQMLSRTRKAGDPSEVNPDSEIRTKFVVDILSGSSAGGINAIYLAKALANDQKIDELKTLWKKEGDIELLINDKDSLEDTGLTRQSPPRSLLNSQRMYWKLLDALEGMDKPEGANAPRRAANGPSPNAEEIDLYVTSTDMHGQPVKLQLADRLVEERRHRNVFHFRYSTQDYDDDGIRNDFEPNNNPFLAFAARCTSAHPAAFEPMRLADIDEVLRVHPSYGRNWKVSCDPAGWQKFYKKYLRPEDGDSDKSAKSFAERCFNDGGVLDNRPFSYAIDTIPMHFARVPVDRKLLYVEPTPERLEEDPQEGEPPPSFVDNAWRSLSTLPSYEPIREDLQRVLERNQMVDRVSNMFKDAEKYIEELHGDPASKKLLYIDEADKAWHEMTLTEVAKQKGIAWASYQRLRVARVTDDLARMIARNSGLDEESDEFLTIRSLVRYWREKHYAADELKEGRKSELEFLKRCDFKWHLRRLNFVLLKVEQMANYSYKDAHRAVSAVTPHNLAVEEEHAFQNALSSIGKELSEVDEDLRKRSRRLWEPREEHSALLESIRREIKKGDREDLESPRGSQKTEEDRRDRAREIFDEQDTAFEKFGSEVEDRIAAQLDTASSDCGRILRRVPPDAPVTAEQAARETVRFYYDTFVNYDMVSYPITKAAGIGEEIAPVEVFRISPEDASKLIEQEPHRPKLAGTKLNNFGAFFKEEFRINDIMWGQFDGAERIISALLPHKDDEGKRNELIDEAHRIILAEAVAEELRLGDEFRLRHSIMRATADTTSEAEATIIGRLIGKVRPGTSSKKREENTGLVKYTETQPSERKEETTGVLARFGDCLQDSPVNDGLMSLLQACVKDEDSLNYFKREYDVGYKTERKFDNESMMRNAARASRVFGGMLEGYSQSRRGLPVPDKVVLWTTRLTQLFWSVVEVSVPRSFASVLYHYWRNLLYVFALLMVFLGVLASSGAVWKFGLVALVVMVAFHVTVWLLGDVISGTGLRWRAVKYTLAVLASIPFVLGLILLAAILGLGSPEALMELGTPEDWVRFMLGTAEDGRGILTDLRTVTIGFLDEYGWLRLLLTLGVGAVLALAADRVFRWRRRSSR